MMANYLVPHPTSSVTYAVGLLHPMFAYAPINYPANGATVGQIWPEYLEPTP